MQRTWLANQPWMQKSSPQAPKFFSARLSIRTPHGWPGGLRDLGINLFYKTTVGDNLDRIVAAMRQGLDRSDLVLVTGGLGPTVDDMTRDAAALATDRDLVLDDACLASIEAIFARWGRKLSDNNRLQAYLPAGSIPVFNPVGTAPGFVVEVDRKGRQPAMLICLPGVPREMMHLMQETIEPLLAQRLGPIGSILRAAHCGSSAWVKASSTVVSPI